MSTNGSWWCTKCNVWVPGGSYHICGHPGVATMEQPIDTVARQNERIMLLLEKILEKLEALKGYVSSNDLDRANDAIDLWIEKKGKHG